MIVKKHFSLTASIAIFLVLNRGIFKKSVLLNQIHEGGLCYIYSGYGKSSQPLRYFTISDGEAHVKI